MVDLLYVAKDRLLFTRESFSQLLANTDWPCVRKLFVADDRSVDGTSEYLADALLKVPLDMHDVRANTGPFGGPVAAMNWYLDTCPDHDVTGFVKIDNDIVVPPGWLPDLLRVVTRYPGVDVFGLPVFNGRAEPCPLASRKIEPAEWIGGVGLVRHRAFSHCRPNADGRQGWTQWQQKHPDVQKAWLSPPMPCFELDRIPFDPWRSLALEYVAKGWARDWGAYDETSTHMWGWWKP